MRPILLIIFNQNLEPNLDSYYIFGEPISINSKGSSPKFKSNNDVYTILQKHHYIYLIINSGPHN